MPASRSLALGAALFLPLLSGFESSDHGVNIDNFDHVIWEASYEWPEWKHAADDDLHPPIWDR